MMISRSTILALVFACFATLSLAGAAEVVRDGRAATQPAMTVYELPRVVVVGKVQLTADAQPSGE